MTKLGEVTHLRIIKEGIDFERIPKVIGGCCMVGVDY